jgi:hypothetical protein
MGKVEGRGGSSGGGEVASLEEKKDFEVKSNGEVRSDHSVAIDKTHSS